MSTHPSDPHQGSPLAVEPEDERIPIKMIVVVAVVSGVVFALGILWAVDLMHGVASDSAQESGPPAPRTEVGKPEIGMVDQTLFAREVRAEQLKEEKLRQLESYGWVSRKNGVIHIPIDEAMKAVAQGKRPPGTGAPQPPPAPLPPVPSSEPIPSSAPAGSIVPAPGSSSTTSGAGGTPAPAASGSSTGATGGAGPNSATQKKP
jgi:hypothetical protein